MDGLSSFYLSNGLICSNHLLNSLDSREPPTFSVLLLSKIRQMEAIQSTLNLHDEQSSYIAVILTG